MTFRKLPATADNMLKEIIKTLRNSGRHEKIFLYS